MPNLDIHQFIYLDVTTREEREEGPPAWSNILTTYQSQLVRQKQQLAYTMIAEAISFIVLGLLSI